MFNYQSNIYFINNLQFIRIIQISYQLQSKFKQYQLSMGNNEVCRICQKEDMDFSHTKSDLTPKRENISRKIKSISNQHRKNPINDSIKQQKSLPVPEHIKSFTGKQSVQYKPGWIYNGDFVRGVREGYGKMTWPSGDFYEGKFINGQANGKGKFQTIGGVIYEGQFINDEIIHGKRLSADRRQIYEGSFKDHNFDGSGYLIQAGQFQYRGTFKKNMMEGLGLIKYSDGSTYNGSFKMNKKDGFGIYTFQNGYKYEGYWKQGEKHGQGILIDSTQQKHIKNYQYGHEVFV